MKLVIPIRCCLIILLVFVLPIQAESNSVLGAEHYQKAQDALRNYTQQNKPGSSVDQSQLELAMQHIERALKVEPTSAIYHQLKGQILERFGNKADAFKSYRKAYDFQPVVAQAMPLATMALRIGKYEDVIEVLRASLGSADPYSKVGLSFRSGLITAYILNKQLPEAEKQIAKQKPYDHSSFVEALEFVVGEIKGKKLKQPKDMDALNDVLKSTHKSILENDRIAKSLDGRKWVIGFEDETKQRYVREYYLPGDTQASWKEVVAVQILKEINMPLQKAMQESEKILKGKCPEIEWKTLKNKKDHFAQVEWQNTGDCSRVHKQYEMTKMVALKDGVLARIAYTSLTVPVEKGVRKQWEKLIGDVSLQHLNH